jgi:hypothetical protein
MEQGPASSEKETSMRKLRGLPVLFIFLALAAMAGALSADPLEPQFFQEETAAPSCDLPAAAQETPVFELEPRAVSDCFCVTDRLYCRRYYGAGYVCQDEPWCGCVYV